jgi:hypothetical protein
MSRPIPLANLATGRHQSPSDHQVLTPRTPHSRSGRAEEGFTEIELEQVEGEDGDDYRAYAHQQSMPLLASSTSDGFESGYRSRGDDYDERTAKANAFQGLTIGVICSRLPLILGSSIAMFLLVLTIVTLKQPDILEEYIGDSVQDISDTPLSVPDVDIDVPMPIPVTQLDKEHTISYENYTTFPLTGAQYRTECQKLNHGFMSHGDYWQPSSHGLMDVPHVPEDYDFGLTLPEGEMTTICKSTITYQLDGHVGLLLDLALMAQAAALAREVRSLIFLALITGI